MEQVQFPYPVAPIVRSHHERWDGNGYPDGIRGEEIPIGARILAAVDCLDALATDRQYRRALPLDEAMRVVVSESGKAYDPAVISILERRAAELEAKAQAGHKPQASQQKPVQVGRGPAPAAGFEVSKPAETGRTDGGDLCRPSPQRARRCRPYSSSRRTWGRPSASTRRCRAGGAIEAHRSL